jgi:hypothetical protein
MFNDLFTGLKKLDINFEVFEINIKGNDAKNPYFNSPSLMLNELMQFIIKNKDGDSLFITIDDFSVMKALYRLPRTINVLIWVNYFKGHAFLFKKYRDIEKEHEISAIEWLKWKLAAYIPQSLALLISRKYRGVLSNSFVLAQSIWSALLTERVYSIYVKGVLYLPIDSNMYIERESKKRSGILVFMGNHIETKLKSLFETIKTLERVEQKFSIDYFGSQTTGQKFMKKYGIDMNYIGSVNREELLLEYASHIIFISPIYNGNFEMAPIESLLSGTPVISYLQPFAEISGFTDMIANINNLTEIEIKARIWIRSDGVDMTPVKEQIAKNMDKDVVAKKLLEYSEMAITMKNSESV